MGLVKVEFSQVLFEPAQRYEQDQLEAAFNAVHYESATELSPHWKESIDAWVPVEDLDLVREAIIHFTGSVLEEVDDCAGLFDDLRADGWVHIRAAGYWNTIGA